MLQINETHHGDCIELMQQIQSKSVDMVFCDLPYGTTNCHWDSLISLPDLWNQYDRIVKDNGAICLTAQFPFDKVLAMSNIKNFRYEWIWEKTQATGHLNSKKMPMRAHETILVFYKKLPVYNPIKTTGHKRKVSTAHHKRNSSTGPIYGKCNSFSDYDSTERYPRDVIKFKSDKQTLHLHPTQKPLELVKYFISTYTNVGDIVLDNCCGSGTTGIAAAELGRNFYQMDIEEGYVNISRDRYKNFTQSLVNITQ